jgi:hypothetical protein
MCVYKVLGVHPRTQGLDHLIQRLHRGYVDKVKNAEGHIGMKRVTGKQKCVKQGGVYIQSLRKCDLLVGIET